MLISSDQQTALACADSAIRRGTLTPRAVAALFATLPARVAAWAPLVDGRSDSGLETIVRLWLRERGIPFTVHAAIPGVGVVDFLVGQSLIIETDGSAFHDAQDAVERDSHRDNFAGSRGYVTVRIRYRVVMFEPELWQGRILEHLRRGDHERFVQP